jgi:hypothetical protein
LKWNQKDVSFGKDILKIKLFGQRPTHVIQYMQSFDCLVFWKQKLTRCKIKMAFSMVLCIHFKLWFWVYLLMVCDEVTFVWISRKTRYSSQNSRLFQERLFLFLAPILLACIITGSLIHEVMTPMEKNSSSFESVIYQFKLLTWLKRAF